MVLFSQMLGVFMTALFISLLVQAFAHNLASLTWQALEAFRSAVYSIRP
jgi:energy-converting hydrogenase Eha subunit E